GCILSYTFGHTNSFSALPLPLTHTFFLISPVLPPSLSLCAHLCISSLFLTPSLSLSNHFSLPLTNFSRWAGKVTFIAETMHLTAQTNAHPSTHSTNPYTH